MSFEGGKFIADNVIASELSVMQVLIFNNTCLGDKGLNSILNQVCHNIRNDQKARKEGDQVHATMLKISKTLRNIKGSNRRSTIFSTPLSKQHTSLAFKT